MYLGPSGFAIMNKQFPVDRFLRQYPKDLRRPFLPVLYDFFGRSWEGIEQFIDMAGTRKHLLEFHLCFRTPSSEIVKFAREIQEAMGWIKKPKTRIIISPILEDNFKDDRDWRRKDIFINYQKNYNKE